MNAIESTGVAVLGLNSNCVELVLRSVGEQHVSEATVIRFRCSSERIEIFGGSFFWEMKCHPVCPFSIARVRVDDEILGSALYSGGELVGAFFFIFFVFYETCCLLHSKVMSTGESGVNIAAYLVCLF